MNAGPAAVPQNGSETSAKGPRSNAEAIGVVGATTSPEDAHKAARRRVSENEAEDPKNDAPQPDSRNREAARYRTQLREAQATNEQLRIRLETMQRREVERRMSSTLQTPDDYWLTGSLADLLDDDGELIEERIDAAAAELIATRPGWAKPEPAPSFDGGARRSAPNNQLTMADVLRGGRNI